MQIQDDMTKNNPFINFNSFYLDNQLNFAMPFPLFIFRININEMKKFIRIAFILVLGLSLLIISILLYKSSNSIGRLTEDEIIAFANNDSLKFASANYLLENSGDKYTRLAIKKYALKIPDRSFISKEYLFKNIDLAFSKSVKRLFEGDFTHEQFLEYVLPYRLRFEFPENWRSYAIEKFDTCYDEDIFIHASNINDLLRTRFAYRSSVKNNQRFSKLHKNGMGACDEMSDMAAFAMRANGIPVAVDFARWANIVGGHQWNSLVLKEKNIPFMGIENNPADTINLELITSTFKKSAKVYRKSFNKSEFADSGFNPKKLIAESNYIDVTKEYYPNCQDMVIHLPDNSKNGKYLFLCVYQVNNWAPIAYSKANNNRVVFKDVGPQNIFSLKVWDGKKLKHFQNPFTFDSLAHVRFLENNFENTTDLKLAFFNSNERELIRSFNENGYIETELKWQSILIDNETGKVKNDTPYQLFYWEDGWVFLSENQAKNGTVFFRDVPKNAVYKIEISGADMSQRFRCFTVEDNNTQNWW